MTSNGMLALVGLLALAAIVAVYMYGRKRDMFEPTDEDYRDTACEDCYQLENVTELVRCWAKCGVYSN